MDKQVQPTNIDELNARLKEISAQVLPEGLVFRYVSVDELHEQTLNPRSMPQRMFDQLIQNIKNVGAPESVPLCAYVDNAIEIISGHHRIRASRAAGVKYMIVLMYENLSRSGIQAKQLAHNTIAGTDDPQMVKRIFDQIIEVQAKFEAYVDPRLFDAIPKPVAFTPIDVDMVSMAKTVLIIFLPSQAVDFTVAAEAIMPKSEVDQIYLANREVYDNWIAALKKIREKCDIVATPTAIAEMARLAVKQLETQAENQAQPEA
jgi:hypothetical protein